MAAQSKIAAAPASPEQSPLLQADNMALPDDVSSIFSPEFTSTPPESFATAPESPTTTETPTIMAPTPKPQTAQNAIQSLIFDQGSTAAFADVPASPRRSTSPPLRLSAAMAEESLDPTAAPHRSYTVAQLVNIINKKKIQLPDDDNKLDPRVPGFDGRKRTRLSDEEIIEEVRARKAEKAKMEELAAADKTAEVDPETTPTGKPKKRSHRSKSKKKKASKKLAAEKTPEEKEERKLNKHIRRMAVGNLRAKRTLRKELAAQKAGVPGPAVEFTKPKRNYINLPVPGFEGRKIADLTEAEALEAIKIFEDEVKEGKHNRDEQIKMAPRAWSVNDRAKKMGVDPAKTINHLAGKGAMVYRSAPRGFSLLDAPFLVKKALYRMMLVVDEDLVPWHYHEGKYIWKLGGRRQKPLVDVLVALCNGRDKKVVRASDEAKNVLYRENKFSFRHPRDFIRFLGAIGMDNISRLRLGESFAVGDSFFAQHKVHGLAMKWITRWGDDLKFHMRGNVLYTMDSKKWIGEGLQYDTEPSALENAIKTMMQVMEEEETMAKVVNADESENVKGPMRIQTLDFGEAFASIEQQIKDMDLGIADDKVEEGPASQGNDNFTGSSKSASKGKKQVRKPKDPYPGNDKDTELKKRDIQEWNRRERRREHVIKTAKWVEWFLDSAASGRPAGELIHDNVSECSGRITPTIYCELGDDGYDQMIKSLEDANTGLLRDVQKSNGTSNALENNMKE